MISIEFILSHVHMTVRQARTHARKQASKHTSEDHLHANVGLTQALPNNDRLVRPSRLSMIVQVGGKYTEDEMIVATTTIQKQSKYQWCCGPHLMF